tara:strand:+ start:2740 stop:2967 length:228 start_codon:yes stop_codon:yes gene_type:complete
MVVVIMKRNLFNTEYTLRFIYDDEQDDADEKYDNDVSLIVRILGILNRINEEQRENWRVKVMKSEIIHTELMGDD